MANQAIVCSRESMFAIGGFDVKAFVDQDVKPFKLNVPEEWFDREHNLTLYMHETFDPDVQELNKPGTIILKWLCGADDPGKLLTVYGPAILFD